MLIKGKNLIALTVKIELALQVYQAKVKRRKPAQTDFAVITPKVIPAVKVPVALNTQKTQVFETVAPILHAVLDVANS